MTQRLASQNHSLENEQRDRVMGYLMQLFSANDYKTLLESVNSKMLIYSDANTFIRSVR